MTRARSPSATDPDGATVEPGFVGQRFARLLAAKRWPELGRLLDAQITFRALTPSRYWEADSPEAVITGVLQHWFDDGDRIEQLLEVEAGAAAGRPRVRYQLRVRNADGLHLVEQHAYYDVNGDGRISRMHMVCAGYRRWPGQLTP